MVLCDVGHCFICFYITKEMKNYNRYTDFLKDEKFVRWQIMPDDELERHWTEFLSQNKQLADEANRASQFLKSTGLNSNQFTEANRDALLNRIRKTVAENRKKSFRRRIFYFSLAASAAIILVVGGVNFYLSSQKAELNHFNQEFIVGSMMNSEDIQLITGSGETLSFENDIEASMSEKGDAVKIMNEGNETTVEMAKNTMNKLVVPFGKRSQLTLADGTRVWLNSGSVLEFPSDFKGDTREIGIDGEIYIDVKPNKQKPFFVRAKEFTVQVTGTKFNVSAYNNLAPSVTLVDGSVRLQSKQMQQISVAPNERVTLSADNRFEKKSVNAISEISWIYGYLTLDKTPVTDVLKQIERYYNFSFNYDNDIDIQNRTCSGKIYLSENIENVMETIALLTSTKIQKENNKIYISNKPQ